ncbi:hypothetical protein P170DRAFT_364181 [Aspergillus steynii IBT 23096]|uniref:G-protein coupled receptors family 2 profile 2 domain-containing protein n=1 Tax=Aspergillus steynii IBT 23096 TaxID=1392250 RepID=A0A2I2FZG8_9EURO|nr:uncharacterized protein P170DRAFT_364181 [Aspergillus steynii IBT 23096]PLB46027.1 hypothetical protein P170DRAFT_364181 [Aspergillus steynii IBT 23096]
MSNNTMHGLCPKPFLQESLFPSSGGFIEGRYCKEIPGKDDGQVSCCLPCPLASWTYGDELMSKTRAASWLSVAVLPLCIFLLVSYAVLPVKWTHRHYLSICFTLGICFMEIPFIIPLGTNPEQCYNQITPKDMHDDLSCAFTGAMLLFGGWVVVVWSFIRTVAFHLQVCWEIVIGKKFMWGAFICGFGIPIIGTTVMLILTGVSFRFGSMCHINIKHSLQDYWAPVMAFAAAASVLQLATMGYCIHVYVRSVFDNATTTNSSDLPSYTSSVRTVTARQAYRRIRRVLQLQWRGVALVLIIIGNVIFFAVVFIDMDKQLAVTPENMKKAMPWLVCLVSSEGDKQKCTKEIEEVGPNQATLLAVLILLSLVGLWNFVLFARPSIFHGWVDLFRSTFGKREEYVSADARSLLPDSRTYEMLGNATISPLKTPEPVVRSPSPERITSPDPGDGSYGRDARYVQPSMSFSSPRPPGPTYAGGREWVPEATFAPGNHQYSTSQ